MQHSPLSTSPLADRNSPPTQAKPESSRARLRRTQQKYQDEFDNNREQLFRSQLIALQHDMNMVTQADLYGPDLLEDSPDDIKRLVEAQASGTPYQSELSSLAGRWYAEFVAEVNEAKEAKEIELIQLAHNHQMRLERLKYECDYRLHLAAEECEYMTNTLRERLVQSLNHKRQRLMKEKEQLDIADTNALLLHPSQFSITNPASPGGNHGNRKTRLTRHRGEQDDLGNGYAAEITTKRKRKAGEDDYGSPSRNGHSTPADRARATNIAHQTEKVYTIGQLFTEKELNFQSHQAQIAARHFFSSSHKEGEPNGINKRNKDDEDKSGSGDESGNDGDGDLEAPGMERTASQNLHVTRSTRNIGGMAGLNILSDLAEKASTRPVLPYATLHTHQGRNGTVLPPPSRLMAEELEEDMLRISSFQAGPEGQVDPKAIEDALKPLAEGRSNLAPDWPVYLDVHLVDMDPRRSAGVS